MFKVLINTPITTLPGGVANHYLGLNPYWVQNVKYNSIGKRSNNFLCKGILFFPYDILKFLYKLFVFRPDFILLNPSFGKNAMPRDMIFLWISKIFNFKTGVFIHGWECVYENSFRKSNWLNILNKADAIFVLSNEFKDKLVNMGVVSTISLTTTKVDDNLIKNFLIKERTNTISNILFLSRIEKEKGIYIAIDAFEIIVKQYPEIKLSIVGSGSELNNIKKYSKKKGLNNIEFKGHLNGNSLINEFKNADVYLFPTYAEGMPTSVLEAMAFGLPIITRPVGGLVDFFNEKMGFFIESKLPEDFANVIIELINNPLKKKQLGDYNYEYAKSKFMASDVAKSLEDKIYQILDK